MTDEIQTTAGRPRRLSAPEAEEALSHDRNASAFVDLYSLRALSVDVIYTEEYQSNDRWADAIKLSSHGKEVVSALTRSGAFSNATMHQAAFLSFYHLEPLLDVTATDAAAIKELLNGEIQSRRIRLPYRFGRLLYDKFFDLFGEARPNYLDPADASLLLENTPQGVYQVGKYISGPLGVLSSDEARYLPVSSSLPLWYCADTGCNAPHEVELLSAKATLQSALAALEKTADDLFGPPSSWLGALNRAASEIRPGHPKLFYQLPTVLAECFVMAERATMVDAALRSENGNRLRAALTAAGIRVDKQPAQLAAELDEATQLQSLLLLKDSDLVRLIDLAVWMRNVTISPAEVRRPRNSPVNLSAESFFTQVSSCGIRLAGWDEITVLESSLWSVYSQLQMNRELDWRLKNSEGKLTRFALAEFIRLRPPRDVVVDLVLASQPVAESLANSLGFSISDVSHDNLADVFLWKMGFNLQWHDELIPTLRRRLTEFRDIVLSLPEIRTEEHRERIRSIGVNLFVSVEHFLEDLIAYNVWLLASDHFVGTQFVYDSLEARTSVQRTLGERLTDDGFEATWSVRGDNTLGALLAYLHGFTRWLDTLISGSRPRIPRPNTQMPHYTLFKYADFPFMHTELWADASPAALSEYAASMDIIVRKLGQEYS